MKISEEEVKNWYELNGVSTESWDNFEDFTKEMIAVEAIVSGWGEVTQLRESGIPESAVLIYFNADDCGLDPSESEYLGEEASYEGLTPYVLQNTTSDNIKRLFDDKNPVNVLSVDSLRTDDDNVHIIVEVEGEAEIFR